jgi:hypothetical protein
MLNNWKYNLFIYYYRRLAFSRYTVSFFMQSGKALIRGVSISFPFIYFSLEFRGRIAAYNATKAASWAVHQCTANRSELHSWEEDR